MNNDNSNNKLKNTTAVCDKCNKAYFISMGCGTCQQAERDKAVQYAAALAQFGGGSDDNKVRKWIDGQTDKRR